MTFPPNQQAFSQMIQEMGEQMIQAGKQLKQNSDRAWFDLQRQTLIASELSEVFAKISQHPELISQFQQELVSNNLHPESEIKDKRFSHATWQQPGFSELKDIYLHFCNACQTLLDNVPDIEESKKDRAQFFVRQWLSAIAPSNFLLTNPEAIAETQKTNGANLVQGMKNYYNDLERGRGIPNIQMADMSAFTPGDNIAATEGQVIYQNQLMQLIQFSPSTENAHERPLLIVPPWINKYYILDLQEKNSFVKWLVNQQHTVFVISWVNPTAELSHKDFADYMKEGVLEAIDAIQNTLEVDSINTLGYCLGGTLLGTALAYLRKLGDKRVHSATFLTTLLDFSFPGELGHFLSKPQFEILNEQLQSEGILSGHLLTSTYNMLRENDLHWSYHVNNYLLGKQPPAFDLLYWNSDSTNLPAAMHRFYLKNMYLENKLKDPGGINIDNIDIDLTEIDVPCFFLSAEKDHIALWQSTYLGAQKMSGETEFVLAGSGHVAGVINPADSGKYCYYTNKKDVIETTAGTEWRRNSEKRSGSWWPYWSEWLGNKGGTLVMSRNASAGKLDPIEPAPGSYVKKQLD